MKKRSFLIVLLVILALAAVVVVLNFTLLGSRYESAVPIRAHTVTRGRLEDRVSGNGSFRPRTSITVSSQISGEVETIRVAENDVVARGDVLITLKGDDYTLALQKVRASLDSARRGTSQSLVTLRAQYRGARLTLAQARSADDKNRELLASKAISEEAAQRSADGYEAAKVSFESAREQLNLRSGLPLDAEPPLDSSRDAAIVEASPEVEQALLSVRSAEDNLKRCTITASSAGTVTLVRPSVGDLVAPSAPLVKIETLDEMLAEIQIDEVDIGKIREGQAAEITSDSLIGTVLRGGVESISPTITTLGSTRVSLVRVRLQRPAGGASPAPVLRAGASCTARIITSTKENALLIPLASFATEEKTGFVYLLTPAGRKNRAGADVYQLGRREITTGSSDVNSVEVTAGLADGDRIAAGNLKLLRDGILVTLKADTIP